MIITKDSETPFDIGVASVVSESLENVICGYHLAQIKPRQELIDPIFLAKQLGNDRVVRYFAQQANGMTRYGLSTAAIENISIWLPSTPDEQKIISRVMQNIDAIIQHTEAMIEKLSNIKAGLMQDLLTKGIDENGEIRDPIRYPERFKDSRLGKIPKDWNVKSIEDLTCHVGSGVTPKGGSEVYEKQGILFIRSQNVIFDSLLFEDIAFISQKIHNQMLRSQLCPFDVLLNITGASIGRCCVFPDNLGEANVNQHVCTIRLKNTNVNKACFLSFFLSSDYGQNQIYCLNAGGNREGLNYQQVRSFLIPWPESEAEFSEIRKRIIKSNESIRSEKRHAQKLKLLKHGLMQDLLTGKVSVAGIVKKVVKPAKTA